MKTFSAQKNSYNGKKPKQTKAKYSRAREFALTSGECLWWKKKGSLLKQKKPDKSRLVDVLLWAAFLLGCWGKKRLRGARGQLFSLETCI